jgi:magnesium-transporting ATPase (P-type)
LNIYFKIVHSTSLQDLKEFLHNADLRFTQPVEKDDYDGLLNTIYFLKEVRDRTYEINNMFEPIKVQCIYVVIFITLLVIILIVSIVLIIYSILHAWYWYKCLFNVFVNIITIITSYNLRNSIFILSKEQYIFTYKFCLLYKKLI